MITNYGPNRREFIQTAAGGAAAVYLGGCSTARGPFGELSLSAIGPVEKSNWDQLAQLALSRVKKGGCAYGDVRLLETRNQSVSARLAAECALERVVVDGERGGQSTAGGRGHRDVGGGA